MPRLLRRTPATEKAAVYNYKDLLKDSFSLLKKQAAGNVARMTGGGMSDAELEEIALAPAGGMLKVAGTSRLLAGLLKRRALELGELKMYKLTSRALENRMEVRFRPARHVFKEALKVPEKEYRRIRGIDWSSMKGEVPGTKGLYFPTEKDISLNPHLAGIETIWHEFTHARQYSPERGARLPGGGSEEAASYTLRELLSSLKNLAEETRMSKKDFYFLHSPIERHARGVSEAAVKYPRDFEALYKYGLKNEVARAKQTLKDFWGEK